MRSFLIVMLLSLFSLSGIGQTSIYSFAIDSIAGNHSINFSAFQKKKILLINAASGDSASWQYEQIKQLQSQYRDSLVIVILPSNSFNTENTNNASMLQFYSQQAGNRFPVTKKISVRGNEIHPLYRWLTQKTKNGVMDSEVKRPFQKYLISKSGKLIGVFSAKVKPFDAPLIRAITTNSN